MNNKTFEVLKWFALVIIPALATFVGLVGKALNWQCLRRRKMRRMKLSEEDNSRNSLTSLKISGKKQLHKIIQTNEKENYYYYRFTGR
ncbi:hypothetical protein EfmJHP10_22360 [Enterococcus faecium]|nr:hypothetical protein EfmJHP10_22360 [Enterococcus faecium]